MARDYNSAEFQKFLDEQQYSRNGILRYEKIFGEDFVSTGGITTTKVSENFGLKNRTLNMRGCIKTVLNERPFLRTYF